MARPKGKHKGGTEAVVRLHRRHPGQAAIASHAARFRVVMCGRRWGKSACGIREICDVALDSKPAGWFAPSYKLALEAWREIVDRLVDELLFDLDAFAKGFFDNFVHRGLIQSSSMISNLEFFCPLVNLADLPQSVEVWE